MQRFLILLSVGWAVLVHKDGNDAVAWLREKWGSRE